MCEAMTNVYRQLIGLKLIKCLVKVGVCFVVIVRGEPKLLTVESRGQASAALLFYMKTPTLVFFGTH